MQILNTIRATLKASQPTKTADILSYLKKTNIVS